MSEPKKDATPAKGKSVPWGKIAVGVFLLWLFWPNIKNGWESLSSNTKKLTAGDGSWIRFTIPVEKSIKINVVVPKKAPPGTWQATVNQLRVRFVAPNGGWLLLRSPTEGWVEEMDIEPVMRLGLEPQGATAICIKMNRGWIKKAEIKPRFISLKEGLAELEALKAQ